MVRTIDEELEIIKAALDQYPRYKNVEANERLLLENCQGKPANAHSVRAVLETIKHRLVANQSYAEAYQQLWAQYPEFKVDANIHYLDSLISVRHSIDYEVLAELVENPQVRQQLVLTPQAAQANADEAERQRMLNEISNGEATYSCRSNNDNRLTVYKTADLAEEPTEVIRDVYNIIMEQRRVEGMSLEDIQKERKRREFERVKALNAPRPLPDRWRLTKDGTPSATGDRMLAGDAVETSAVNIKRMHRDDLMALIRNGGQHGADLVNERLGVKKPQQFGNVQIIRS